MPTVTLTSASIEMVLGGLMYRDMVLSAHPLAYWRLGEASGGTAEDETPNNRDGTYEGTPTLGAVGATGDGNTAVQFDGSTGTQRVNCGTPAAFDLPGDCSVEFFVRFQSFTTTRTMWSDADAAGDHQLSVYVESSGGNFRLLASQRHTDATELVVAGTTALFLDSLYHHIAVVRDHTAKTLRLYLDGVAEGPVGSYTGKTVMAQADCGFKKIGQKSTAVEMLDGRMDEVAIYGKVLSATEISSHYAARARDWTNVMTDVQVASEPVRWQRGIQGTGPEARVASTGVLTFALDNSVNNSAALNGYYTPGHANQRSGFDVGVPVRLRAVYSAVTYDLFYGTLDAADPVPGIYGERVVRCSAVDWIEHAARAKVRGVAAQVNKRSDELVVLVRDAVPFAPVSSTIGTGKDTYPYALDTASDREVYALEELQRIAQSELGQVYVSRSGVLHFEHRHKRQTNSVQILMSDAAGVEQGPASFEAQFNRRHVINAVGVTDYPRKVDAAVVVLAEVLEKKQVDFSGPWTGTPATPWVVFAAFRDPNNKDVRVGGTELVTPVATTDYTMNSAQDGSGTDLTANFTVTIEISGNGVRFTVSNNAQITGPSYVTKLQVRGKGIYLYDSIICESEDEASIILYGRNEITFETPYSTDPPHCQETADYIRNRWTRTTPVVQRMVVHANRSDPLMLAALQREVSDRITITEAMTAAEGSVDDQYHIQAVSGEIGPRNIFDVTWDLVPANTSRFWLLGTTGASNLGQSTVLGF